MDEFLARAAARQKIAEDILQQLDLLNRWSRYGKPILVGSVALELVVAPDIDIEVYCPDLRIEDGFEVLAACASHPQVSRARFWNALFPPHHGLYWRLDYIDEQDVEWKTDMWAVADTYSGPCGAKLVEPLKKALTNETRSTILRLKEAVLADESTECFSIQIYRAVLDFGVRSFGQLKSWLRDYPLGDKVTDWKPGQREI